ncbi:FAD-binding oxidoreductase [Halosegnis sp.]|uniref:FAD-binding oxidoreductase n=1 Tax=Halosegnis sp. TaxID=2864959 RepID=UPI0035D43C86
MSHDCSFLRDVLPDDQVAFTDATRAAHADDWGTEGTSKANQPDAVVYPESTEDVAAVLAAADERGIPVTPYAAGTSMEGNPVPRFGGVSLDLTRMDAVLEVRLDDFQIDVQPGVLGSAVDEAVADHGMFFPPLPSSGSISTVGGMIANDASGMQTVKYGEVGDWVLELEAVTAAGETFTAGSTAKKTSAGYNLADLLVGSEGTLAVVTRATLELAGRPDQIRGGRAVFPSLGDAADAVFDAVRSGVDVAKIELLDETAGMMANDYFGLGLPDSAMIFVEFHADHHVEEEIAFCRSVFEAHDVSSFEIAADDEMDELWAAREELAFAVGDYDPDLTPLHPGDITVPISKLPEIIRYAKQLAAEHELLIPCFGHAGDGNVHYTVLADESDEAMVERGEQVYAAIVERAIELGGTATGEHGVGMGKRDYLEAEHGAVAVDVMRRVKGALDPNDTLNPGKLFPETDEGDGRVLLEGVGD